VELELVWQPEKVTAIIAATNNPAPLPTNLLTFMTPL
jgi:hypothetical protein